MLYNLLICLVLALGYSCNKKEADKPKEAEELVESKADFVQVEYYQEETFVKVGDTAILKGEIPTSTHCHKTIPTQLERSIIAIDDFEYQVKTTETRDYSGFNESDFKECKIDKESIQTKIESSSTHELAETVEAYNQHHQSIYTCEGIIEHSNGQITKCELAETEKTFLNSPAKEKNIIVKVETEEFNATLKYQFTFLFSDFQWIGPNPVEASTQIINCDGDCPKIESANPNLIVTELKNSK